MKFPGVEALKRAGRGRHRGGAAPRRGRHAAGLIALHASRPAWYTPLVLDTGLERSTRTRPNGAAARALGAWRLGGEPPGGSGMRLSVDKKKGLIEQFKTHEGDTGSPEVQIALLSERINGLTDHFKTAPEGPPLPPRPAHADRQAPRAPRVPAQEGHGALPSHHGKARDSQVTADPDWIDPRRSPGPAGRRVSQVATHSHSCPIPSWRTADRMTPHSCRSRSTACRSPSRPARSPSRPTAPWSSAAAAPWCCPPSSRPGPPMEGRDFLPAHRGVPREAPTRAARSPAASSSARAGPTRRRR